MDARENTEHREHAYMHILNEAVSQRTIEEREVIVQHIRTQRDPEFGVEYHTPDGVVVLKLMLGKAPDDSADAMPSLPGPTTYKAAIKSANWREWLKNFIAEIEGQIEVGYFSPGRLASRAPAPESSVRVHAETSR
jgi:hypothetical protein